VHPQQHLLHHILGSAPIDAEHLREPQQRRQPRTSELLERHAQPPPHQGAYFEHAATPRSVEPTANVDANRSTNRSLDNPEDQQHCHAADMCGRGSLQPEVVS
jgi:hypothetical protein